MIWDVNQGSSICLVGIKQNFHPWHCHHNWCDVDSIPVCVLLCHNSVFKHEFNLIKYMCDHHHIIHKAYTGCLSMIHQGIIFQRGKERVKKIICNSDLFKGPIFWLKKWGKLKSGRIKEKKMEEVKSKITHD